MRWLVNEGLPRMLAQWLRARGDDVLDMAASPWRGAADYVLWRLAAESQRAIILHVREPYPPGIVLIRVPDTRKAQAITGLVQRALAIVAEPHIYRHIMVIEPDRIRQRPIARAEGRAS